MTARAPRTVAGDSSPVLRRPFRTRALGVGNLRAFLAVAQHLSFRAAAETMALTQSAVSRQVQALEQELGTPLFLRHTRAVELTRAGQQLLRTLEPTLARLDATVREIRQGAQRQTVSLSTWSSFASLWLIPRLGDFQRAHPEIDLRIQTTDALVDLEVSDVDLALRYARAEQVPPDAERLFGEQLTPVASPLLRATAPAISVAEDLRLHTLVEVGVDPRSPYAQWLSWQRWLDAQGLRNFEPRRWLYFHYAHQIIQASQGALGVALARLPLVTEQLANGSLCEILPHLRLDSPLAYWLALGPRSSGRVEVQVFCQWLRAQAAATRVQVGELDAARPAPQA